jgi:outer membrane protein
MRLSFTLQDSLRQCLLAGLGLTLSGLALGADIFNTAAQVPANPAAPQLGDAPDACRQVPRLTELALFDAVARNLCESPKTHAAWLAVQAAAAAVGQGQAAYLPRLDASGEYSYEHDVTNVAGEPGSRTDFAQPVNTESLTLTWVLYDFGGRSAVLKNSRQLLLAAKANENATLQAAIASTAKDYYAAQAGNARVQSTLRIEAGAQQILAAATARFHTGLSPVTEVYQANTAQAQAVYERAKAQGDSRIALGTMATDMSLPPDETLTLPDLNQSVAPDTAFVQSVRDLIDTATNLHPAVLAARAQWQAALANVQAVRAVGYPKISLVGSASRSDQPLTSNLGVPEVPATSRSEYAGVKIDIPLFEGFDQHYKIRQAEAQAQAAEQAVRDAQQQTSLGVWMSFQTLDTATANVRNTNAVLASARQSFEASLRRYQSGVGSILDLLSVQNTLAGAEQQQIQAQLDWRTARLQLAASIGQLEVAAVR